MAEPDLTSIYQALLKGHPTAPRDLVNACSARLYAILKHRFAPLPRETIEDAAYDALLALIAEPRTYDPSRGSLINLLVHIGSNKLVDQLRKLRRRGAEIPVGGSVELAQAEAKHLHESDYGGRDPELPPPEVEALLCEILPDPRDRRVWDLVCDGRTPVEEFAAVLGLQHLTPAQMKAEVKRHRDRVVKKVQRRREEFRRYLL